MVSINNTGRIEFQYCNNQYEIPIKYRDSELFLDLPVISAV